MSDSRLNAVVSGLYKQASASACRTLQLVMLLPPFVQFDHAGQIVCAYIPA